MRSPEAQPALKSHGIPPEPRSSIAVAGKGGAGKTMLVALMIKAIARSSKQKILAIDADSSVSLPYALRMTIGKTVSEIRREIIEVPEVKRRIADQHIKTVMKDALVAGNGYDLLTMGRPEEPGCFCAMNDLLRYGIDMLAQDSAITVIDGEAGPEQLNRRVLKNIDVLLIVADRSARSLQTASTIIKVALGHGNVKVEKAYLIVNRSLGQSGTIGKRAQEMGLEILGHIPEDEKVSEYDGVGKPLLELPWNSPSVVAVRRILKKLILVRGQ